MLNEEKQGERRSLSELMGKSAALDEQLARTEQRERLQKEIARLEKKARAERQPKKKFELVQQMHALKRELEDTHNG